MAAIKAKVRDKMAQEFIHFLVFLHVIDSFVHCQPTIETSGQAFVQTDNELRYMVDGVHLQIPGQKIVDIRWDDATTNPVLFEPPLLDFEEQPLGMPHLEQVTVQNTDTKNSLHLLSISGSTSHFHCSFFQDKHVPPGGNTTFEVVFLARRVGNVENTLYIHTSVGTFKYQVFGVGIPNPYRVRPLLGAKVAINTSFSPLIHLHNPHSSTLQVEEVYTSGGDLHLQLPSGEIEATKQLWEIPPYDTKPIMKASFLGRVENNHTAFIRIKTNKENRDNILVLPVEVEVSADPGIFSTLDKLDFGIVRSCDPPKKLELSLYSSRVYPVPIQEVYVSPPNDAIQIDFQPTYLKADLWEPSTIARISFNASRAEHIKQSSGVIVIKSKTESHRHVIPYQATVLHGYLFYDKNKTHFFTGQPNRTISRNLPISNMFNFSLAIHNISISEDKADYFSIGRFENPIVIRALDTKIPFILHFYMNETGLHFKTHLLLHTNASTFYIPIHVYNGKLKSVHHRPEIFRGQLDFGTVDLDTEYSMLLTLRNENPINIIVRQYVANVDRSHVELLGVEEGNGTMLTRRHNTSLIPSPLIIPPGHFAVFNVSVITREEEGAYAGDCTFFTQFQNLYVPITLRTYAGSLQIKPEIVVLDNCFPTRVCRREFSLNSSFHRYMKITEIVYRPADSRFLHTPPSSKDIVLEPMAEIGGGTLSFDVSRGPSGCQNDCYLGLPTHVPAGYQWLQGSALQIETPDIDQYLYTRFKQKWAIMQQQQTNVVNVTMQLDTNEVRGFLYHAQAHLKWPSVARQSRIHFPLTQIGNTSVHELLLENPSDVPVIVQVLPLIHYPSPETILNLIGKSITADLTDILDSTFSFAFSIQDLERHDPHYMFTRRERRKIEKIYNVETHPDTLVMTLNASSSFKLHVGFTPHDDTPTTSLLVVRNNLTIIETVVVQGTGGRGDMRLGNKKTGSTLVFEVTEKNCDKKKSSKVIPNFTVKNKLTAKNTGQLPFYVNSFAINDRECEGYGFKVLDCGGFELAPNDSKTVTVAFTPDFSMSRVQRVLTIQTSLGPAVNYTLQAIVPPHLLTKCSAALPRPSWEPLLYYSIVCFMGFVLFCIFVAAYFEADRICAAERIRAKLHATLPPGVQSNGTTNSSKIFDLNNLNGEKVANGGCSHRTNGVVGHSKSTYLLPSTSPPTLHAHAPVRPSSGRKKRDTSISSHIYKALAYLKFPFKLKLFKPTKSERNSSSAKSPEKESKSSSKSSDIKTDTSPSLTTQTTILRRSSSSDAADESARNQRKTKTAKRPFPDLIEDVVGRAGDNKGSKGVSNDSLCNTKNKPADRKKNDKFNGTEQTDSRSHNSTPEIDDEEQREKRNRKWKKESAYVERRTTAETDETSSTTTESSVEVEEKSSTHDSTPEPVPPKCKKSRGKGNKKKDASSDLAKGEHFHEDEFIIGSKSKAHKKMSGDFGGNILRPSSLELPYKMEGDSPKPGSNDLSPHALVGRRSRNKNKKKEVCKNPEKGYIKAWAEAAKRLCGRDQGHLTHFVGEIVGGPVKDSDDSSDVNQACGQIKKAAKNIPAPISAIESHDTEVTATVGEGVARSEERSSGSDCVITGVDTMSKELCERPVKREESANTHSSQGEKDTKLSVNAESAVERASSEKLLGNLAPFNLDSLEDNNGPLPLWDQPKPIETNDDLSEMALQTQLFAQKSRGGAGGGSLSDTLSTSSRSSSYSSIVSSGSDSKANGKDRNSGLSPIGIDARAPGTMVNNKGNPISPGIAGARKSAWLGGGTESQLSPGNSFGLEPITESPPSVGSSFTGASPLFSSPGASGPEGLGKFSPSSLAQPQPQQQQQQQPATMMQCLMAERRKRQMEYEQKRLHEKWPFFDTVLPQENTLWDMTSTASDTWSASSQPANTIWDPALPGSSSGTQTWGNVGSIWSSPSTLSPEVSGSCPTGDAVLEQAGVYDPFNSLWNPSGFGMQGQTWPSFSPPKPDEN